MAAGAVLRGPVSWQPFAGIAVLCFTTMLIYTNFHNASDTIHKRNRSQKRQLNQQIQMAASDFVHLTPALADLDDLKKRAALAMQNARITLDRSGAARPTARQSATSGGELGDSREPMPNLAEATATTAQAREGHTEGDGEGEGQTLPTGLVPLPRAAGFTGPRKLLLICLFTGGSQHSTGDQERVDGRVNAQLSSWADTDVYYVTHMDVATDRRIWLPDEAEAGGYKEIWKKTLHLFHNVSNGPFGQQYDYVFKGDDDTVVNLPLLRYLLRHFDERLPFQLGNDGYGVGCRGPAPTSPFYHQDRGTKPCHGGAGYILSRGAIEMMAPHFLGCAEEWPSTSYEDAKMSYCLKRHAAVNCIGMKIHFGWDRYHNVKRDKVASKIKALERQPLLFARGISFHPVPEEFQGVIHNHLQNLTAVHNKTILQETNAALAESHRYLVGQWNCTKDRPGGAINALCQKYVLKRPPLKNLPRDTGVICRKQRHLCDWVEGRQGVEGTANLTPVATDGKKNAVMVVLAPALNPRLGPIRERALRMLVSSLRRAGSHAVVVLLVDAVHHAMAEAVAADIGGGSEEIVIRSVGAVPPEDEETSLRGFGMLALLVARFLERGRDGLDSVMLCGPNTLFQLDPFGAVPYDDGVAVFMTETFPANLTLHKTDARLAMQWMGTCNSRDDRAAQGAPGNSGPNSFRGPGVLDTSVIIGTAIGVEVAMAELAVTYDSLDKRYRSRCSPEHRFSRLVWYADIAERVPVMIPLQSSSPAVNLESNDTSLWSIEDGVILNSKGGVAAVVVAPHQCLCCDDQTAQAAAYPSSSVKLCPTAALPS